MNVLVTGGTGFTGSHLCKALLEREENVITIVRDLKTQTPLKLLGLDDEVNLVRGDVEDYSLLERVLSDYEVDVVYHLAAQAIVKVGMKSPVSTFETNIKGTWNLLEATKRCGVKAFLYASTDKVYGVRGLGAYEEETPLDALDVYGASKACADILARAYHRTFDLPVVVSRACNIYGPADLNPRIIPNTIKACLKGEDPIIYREHSKREYIFVDDVVEGYIALVDNIDKTKGKAYNLGSGQVLTQEEVVLEVLKYFPNLKPVYAQPQPYMSKEIKFQRLISRRITEEVGWSARTTFEEGIRRTVEWWKSR